MIGGNGPLRTLPLAARYADEWNAVYLPANEFERLNARLDELLRRERRDPAAVRRSMMTGCVFGRDPQEVVRKVEARTKGERTVDDLRGRGLLVGTAPEIADQLEALTRAGVQRVMLQWLDQDDLDGLQALASVIIG